MDITIEIASPADVRELLAIYAPYVTGTAVTFEYDVPSTAEFATRIENTLEKYPYFVARASGKIAGYAYAGPLKHRAAYGWAVETSIYVSPESHRLGIGSKLYGALERALCAQNITNMHACIAKPEEESEYLNFSSVHFHKAMGFSEIGVFHQCGYKFGRWFSMLWMEKMISEHRADQPSVIPFSELRGIDALISG